MKTNFIKQLFLKLFGNIIRETVKQVMAEERASQPEAKAKKKHEDNNLVTRNGLTLRRLEIGRRDGMDHGRFAIETPFALKPGVMTTFETFSLGRGRTGNSVFIESDLAIIDQMTEELFATKRIEDVTVHVFEISIKKSPVHSWEEVLPVVEDILFKTMEKKQEQLVDTDVS